MENECKGHCHWFEVFYGSVSFLIFFSYYYILSVAVDIFSGLVALYFFHFLCVYIADNLHIITINGIIRFYRDLIALSYGNAAVTIAPLLLPPPPLPLPLLLLLQFICSVSQCAKWFLRYGIVLKQNVPTDLIQNFENNFNYFLVLIQSWQFARPTDNETIYLVACLKRKICAPEHMDT